MALKDSGNAGAGLRMPPVAVAAGMLVAAALAVGVWQIARQSGGPEVAAPIAPDDGVVRTPSRPSAGPLDEATVAELVRGLSAAPAGSPAWIAASNQDADALARAEQLASILERAGWTVHPIVRTPQRNKPGYFILQADEEPLEYTQILSGALERAGLRATLAVGYRQYAEEQARMRPGFVGLRFEPGQTFVLVVGRAGE
jgi:hypothetical protein